MEPILAGRSAAIKSAGGTANVGWVRARVFVGDARSPQGAGLKPASVDCIVTSPPYWNLKKYGDEVDGEIGHGQSFSEYLADMERVFAECFALAKATGVMWVIADTLRSPPRTEKEYELLPLPNVLAEVAQSVGWRFHDIVIWRKNKTLPYSGDRKLRNLIEYIVLLAKSRDFKHRPFRLSERHQPHAEWLAGWPERYHPLGKNPSNIWEIDIPTQGIWSHGEHLHFCPLPSDLVRRCIDLTTDPGDVVFDPFAGIGTVPAQAEAMGREGLGTELNERFIEIFETRTRPEFLASWEEGARLRQLARDDQSSEAALIYRVRALKAGKELMRHLERTAQGQAGGHASSEVESVIVRLPRDPAEFIDVLTGRCEAPPVELLVVGNYSEESSSALTELLTDALATRSFTTFSLDLSFELVSPAVADEELRLVLGHGGPKPLYEFDVSRHGAFTQRPAIGLFPTLPRLLASFDLGQPLHPSTLGPLEQARAEGEKRLLQSLLGTGQPLEVIAQQLRLPLVELDELLRKYRLAPSSPAFAIALPDDLADRAERSEA